MLLSFPEYVMHQLSDKEYDYVYQRRVYFKTLSRNWAVRNTRQVRKILNLWTEERKREQQAVAKRATLSFRQTQIAALGAMLDAACYDPYENA